MIVPAPRVRPGRRGPKAPVDPQRPLAVLRERERTAGGGVEDVLTVFLAGAECPFGCVFCDLWRHTLDGPTPAGALPRQLARALDDSPVRPQRVKLYNASNFFDERAVPAADDAALATLLAGIPTVTVECHPRLVGRRCFEFAARLDGRLEVAMGLETVHPGALPRLGKAMTLADFDAAAAALAAAGLDLRAFVLVGAPFVPATEVVASAVASARHARERGARHVALIPVRPSTEALAALAARGDFTPPALADLEAALDACLPELDGVVTADLWEVGRFAACPACRDARLARLARLNASGHPEPRVVCAVCGAGRRP